VEVAVPAQDLAERERIEEQAERGAVLRGDIGHVAGGLNARAAEHGLDHDLRIAGNVARERRREHAGIEVVAAAGREADIEADGFAAIEVGDRLGSGRGRHEQHSGRGDAYRQPSDRHRGSPALLVSLYYGLAFPGMRLLLR